MYAMNVLKKQLADLMKNDDIGASVGLENEEDLFVWNIIFEGPVDTLYEVSPLDLISREGSSKHNLNSPKTTLTTHPK